MRDPVGEFGAAAASPKGPDGLNVDDAAFQSIVSTLVDHVRAYMDDEVLPACQKAWRYYHMQVDQDPMGTRELDGRTVHEGSRVVESRVRDAINSVLPELYRVFLGSQEVVEFEPRFAEDVEPSRQATDVISARFWRNDGARFVHDNLLEWLMKFSAVRVWHEPVYEDFWSEFEGLDDAAIALLQEDPEIVELEAEPTQQPIIVPGPDGNPVTMAVLTSWSGRLRRTVLKQHEHKFSLVPQEELLVDGDARSMDTARLVGTDSYRTVSEIVCLGIDYETVKQHVEAGASWTRDRGDLTRWDRGGMSGTVDHGLASSDLSTQYVRVVDVHVRVDRDGDGIAEVYHVLALGGESKVVFCEEAEWPDYIISSPFPIPHKLIGEGLAELMMDRQDIATALIRRFLDNLAQSVRPRSIGQLDDPQDVDAVESLFGGHVNVDPARLSWWSVPFSGQYALQGLEYFQTSDVLRSGVHPGGVGLDPDILKGQTVAGTKAIVGAPQNRTEFYARIFAETVMRPLFKALLKLNVRFPNIGEVIRLRNRWVPVDPRQWCAEYDCNVKVGLGTGSRDERLIGIQMILAKQEQLLAMGSPLATPETYHRALSDLTTLVGIKDVDRYFQIPSPEVMQAAQQQAEQAKQQQLQEVVQVEGAKAQAKEAAKLPVETQKLQAKAVAEGQKLEAKALSDAQKAQFDAATKQLEHIFKERLQAQDHVAREREQAMEASYKQQLALLEGKIEIALQKVRAPAGDGDIPRVR